MRSSSGRRPTGGSSRTCVALTQQIDGGVGDERHRHQIEARGRVERDAVEDARQRHEPENVLGEVGIGQTGTEDDGRPQRQYRQTALAHMVSATALERVYSL